jgi:DNA-binding GntR family transcriptional regulator
MVVSKLALRLTLGSDLKRTDSYGVKPHEHKELPELTEVRRLIQPAAVSRGADSLDSNTSKP